MDNMMKLSIDEIKTKCLENNLIYVDTETDKYYKRKILVTCKEHNETFWISWKSLKKNKKLLCCRRSSREDFIADYLKYMNIVFESECILGGLKYKKFLKFDFYLPRINICIEYDGEHHFKPREDKTKTKEENQRIFEEIKIRDKIKDNFCKEVGIEMIRIPYYFTDEQIMDIIFPLHREEPVDELEGYVYY